MFICILARSARTQANLFVSLISSYTIFLSISSAAGDFTVGLLIPLNDAADIGGDIKAGKYYASAISVAVDRINQQPDLLPGHNISFIWNDTACDEEKTLQALIYQIYDAKVSAVIGPGCTCNTSARNAAAFNIPMISYVSTNHFHSKHLIKLFCCRGCFHCRGCEKGMSFSVLRDSLFYRYFVSLSDEQNGTSTYI